MFDIGLQEIILIGVVALVVLGPEKMPGAVRTVALMIGRLKRSFNALKTEIEKEVGADEIRRQLRNEDIMAKTESCSGGQNNYWETVHTMNSGELRATVVAMQSRGAAQQTNGLISSQRINHPTHHDG
jgi:sec-independent protein translocase protein TatB